MRVNPIPISSDGDPSGTVTVCWGFDTSDLTSRPHLGQKPALGSNVPPHSGQMVLVMDVRSPSDIITLRKREQKKGWSPPLRRGEMFVSELLELGLEVVRLVGEDLHGLVEGLLGGQ